MCNLSHERAASDAHFHAEQSKIAYEKAQTSLEALQGMYNGPITSRTVEDAKKYVVDARKAFREANIALRGVTIARAEFGPYSVPPLRMVAEIADRIGSTDPTEINAVIREYENRVQEDVVFAKRNFNEIYRMIVIAEHVFEEMDKNVDHVGGISRPVVASESGTDDATGVVSDKQGDASTTPTTEDNKTTVADKQPAAVGSSPDSTVTGDQPNKSPVESRSVFNVVKRNPIKTAAGLALAAAAIWSIRALISHPRHRDAMNAMVTTTNSTSIPTTISASLNVTTNSTKI